MGHVRLRTLPRSKLWREVVELVSAGASVSEVAAASATAAKRALAQAGSDPEFLFVARLLVELPPDSPKMRKDTLILPIIRFNRMRHDMARLNEDAA